MRINARIDDELASKVVFLEKETGLSLTGLIKKSLTLFYQQNQKAPGNPLDILEETGFIGCAKGGRNLSTDYKKHLLKGISKKHGDR
ncbi:MAG: CopG family transcriptional regulator [Deltaproteobacteria bacterium]|nr:CopG family transcriptional regulator [Deltaproteobacteria bacterium]